MAGFILFNLMVLITESNLCKTWKEESISFEVGGQESTLNHNSAHNMTSKKCPEDVLEDQMGVRASIRNKKEVLV